MDHCKKLINLFLLLGMCFHDGNGLINSFPLSDQELIELDPQQDFPQGDQQVNEDFRSRPCDPQDSVQDDCLPKNIQSSLPSELLVEQQVGRGDFSGDEKQGGEYQATPAEDLSRVRRYPEHLDPTKIAFFPFWLRIGECPVSSDGLRQHFCPTPTTSGKWVCIDDYQLCDGMKNCPNAEDESSTYCMFFKSLKSEVELLTKTVSALSTATGVPPPPEESLQEYPITATIRKYENVQFPWQSGSK